MARWRPTKAVSPRSSARSKRARPLSRRVAVKVATGAGSPFSCTGPVGSMTK
jgi:hypothetical protein